MQDTLQMIGVFGLFILWVWFMYSELGAKIFYILFSLGMPLSILGVVIGLILDISSLWVFCFIGFFFCTIGWMAIDSGPGFDPIITKDDFFPFLNRLFGTEKKK